jgi:hypothetical protein
MDIFQGITKESEQNPQYQSLNTLKAFSPAKNILDEICKPLEDKDGNFVQQFQTTAFYQRLWEIFLHSFFVENNFEIINKKGRPDFQIQKNGVEIFVEACSSNPAVNDKFTNEFIEASIKAKDKESEQDLKDYYTIKIGSILFSKLTKKYWDLDWVKGKPFILAVMPSHNKLANFLPDYKVIEYLYGKWFKAALKEDGKIEGSSGIVTAHNYGQKKIPSGFFEQPDTENISAVIFTNTCETQKFNRMGQQGKYHDNDVIIVRTGSYNNNEPDGPPKYFSYQVAQGKSLETWSEGVSVLHNPNAKHPFDKSIFKGVRQIWTDEEGRLDGEMPPFYPFNSVTGVVARTDD